MFDSLDEAALLEEMRGAQQAERVAVARRLLAAGEGATGDGPVRARRRLEAWVDCLLELAEAPS